jgi:membrane protein implicated in regulation of membrane protease activity
MVKKGELSLLKAWLIIAASLIDDVLILAIIFLGLWLFHVEITWPLILIVIVMMIVFIFIMHKSVIPAIRRRIVVGAEAMVGKTGEVTESLNPTGMVKIKGEYWKATVTKGAIYKGEDVEVLEVDGLILKVRKKQSEL